MRAPTPAALLALGLALGAAVARAEPVLVVTAPPSLAPVAARLSRLDRSDIQGPLRLSGLLDPGAPIAVALEPEGTDLARGTPEWISGFAEGERIVLFPARAPLYPDGDLGQVLQHEVAHVLVARAASFRSVPRWFNEGVAMFAGRSAGFEDRARFALALLAMRRVPLSDLSRLFEGDHAAVSRAYAISGAFVNDLLEHYGVGLPGAVLKRVREGERFEDAYRQITGAPLALEEDRFWKRRTSFEGVISLLSSTGTLWGAIALLAIVAFWIRRRRDAAVRRRWEAEEAARATPAAPDDLESADTDGTVN